MNKHLAFFRISLKKTLEIRTRILIWFLYDVGPALIMLFFWQAVFKTRSQVAGYDFTSLVYYYFVIMFCRDLVLTHPDEPLQQEILSGQINVYLSRPLGLLSLKLLYELAYKFFKFLYLVPVLIGCYFLFLKGKSFGFDFKLVNLAFFLLSCGLSFCLYFFLKFSIGILAFWFTDVEWVTSLEELVFWFFGGLLLPLDLLPVFMQRLAKFLPFQYLFYLPSQGLLGRLTPNQMFFSLLIQFFWLFLFFILAKRLYRAGLKIYAAFGG